MISYEFRVQYLLKYITKLTMLTVFYYKTKIYIYIYISCVK